MRTLHLAIALSLLVGLASVPGTAAAAPDDRCSWLPSAIRLARSIDGVSEQRATNIRAALQQLGVTSTTQLPTSCGSGTAPDPNRIKPLATCSSRTSRTSR